jgi:hypothetical protein
MYDNENNPLFTGHYLDDFWPIDGDNEIKHYS